MSNPTDKVTSLRSARNRRSSAGDEAFIPTPSDSFVRTPKIERIERRAMRYLEAGHPVHLSGPAGTGKTCLAFHLAAKLDQPSVLLHGDAEYDRSDLVGANTGYRKSREVDNFIASVLKTKERVRKDWVDRRLSKACRHGYTLIYDEFTRSTADANNVLLSVLEERILNLPTQQGADKGYIRVSPDFRGIFTSNPEEYAGTHRAQDALIDRLITVHVEPPAPVEEAEIVTSRTELEAPVASKLVAVVERLREESGREYRPTIRATLTLAEVVEEHDDELTYENQLFRGLCRDVLYSGRLSNDSESIRDAHDRIDDAVEAVFGDADEPTR